MARANTTTSKQVANFMKRNITQMRDLPIWGAWTLRAVGWDSTDIGNPKAKGCVKKVDQIRYSPAGADAETSKTHIWTLTDQARDFMKEYDSSGDVEMPCGHIGFVNEKGTDYYACKSCGGRWTRTELADKTCWCSPPRQTPTAAPMGGD